MPRFTEARLTETLTAMDGDTIIIRGGGIDGIIVIIITIGITIDICTQHQSIIFHQG